MCAPLPAEGRRPGPPRRPDLHGGRPLHGRRPASCSTFVGQHVGSALSRVRAIEETRQRNAELGLINEIGGALAKQLDFDSIVDLVGERVRAIFDATDMFVAIHDAGHGLILFPFEIVDGERITTSARSRSAQGLTSTVIDSRRPLRLATHDEMLAHGGRRRLGAGTSRGSAFRSLPAIGSWASSPSRACQRYAYSEADERFLSTPRVEHGRRPRERPPVRRDEAAALRTRPTAPPSSRSSTRSARRSPSSSSSTRSSISSASGSGSIFDADLDVHRALRRGDEHRPVPVRPGTPARARRDAEVALGPGLTSTDHHDPPTRPRRLGCRGDRLGAIQVGGDRYGVVPRRADHERRPGRSAWSPSSRSSATPSANPTSGCSRPSHRAWASLSRTPACSTRPSGCSPSPNERTAELSVINEIGAALARAARLPGDRRSRRRSGRPDLRHAICPGVVLRRGRANHRLALFGGGGCQGSRVGDRRCRLASPG